MTMMVRDAVDYLDRRFGRWAGNLFVGALAALLLAACVIAIVAELVA